MTSVLKGVSVVEAANFVSGPYTTQLLADLGASVIKVEKPQGGDPFRVGGENGYTSQFCSYNPHKRSLTLDITKPRGAEIFLALTTRADVVVENFRPGVMDRLGLGWETLHAANPRLIYCAITGFGQDGPYMHRPAYDSVAGSLSGFLSQFVDPANPQILGPAIADAVTGLYASYGILGALHERHVTGIGRRVDVNMIESMIAFLREPFARYFHTGRTPTPQERPAASLCFAFRCADNKLLSVHISWPEKFWDSLLSAVERPDLATDTRFNPRSTRVANYAALIEELAGEFVKKPRGEWLAILDRVDVPFAPINDFAEVLADPQVRHLGTVKTYRHPSQGDVPVVNPPLRFDSARDFEGSAPPLLGEHTDEVLEELGLSSAEIASLKADQIC